jgi:hypothetical protein
VRPAPLRLDTGAMSERQQSKPQDARTRRRAEALRRNLRRRKLQARGRAAGERAANNDAKPQP